VAAALFPAFPRGHAVAIAVAFGTVGLLDRAARMRDAALEPL
jgi:hypothetical protein